MKMEGFLICHLYLHNSHLQKKKEIPLRVHICPSPNILQNEVAIFNQLLCI